MRNWTWKDAVVAPLFAFACALAFIGAVIEVIGEEIYSYAEAMAAGIDRFTGRGQHAAEPGNSEVA